MIMSVDFISEEEIEKLLRFVPSSIEEAVIVTDIYTHILFMNYTAEKLTSYSKASVYGRTIVEAFGIFNEKTSELVEVSKEKINGVTLKFGDYTSLITRTGKKLSIAGSVSPIKNEADEIIGLVILLRNVTEQKQFEKQLQYISMHDALTGSYNRVWFEDETLRKKVESQSPVGVIVCDVDGLKMINDTLGHKTGDKVLISTVRILKECIPEEGMVARIGGDEFVVLLPESSAGVVMGVCKQIEYRIAKYNEINSEKPLSLSKGFAISDSLSANIDSLFLEADNNMYKEKLHHAGVLGVLLLTQSCVWQRQGIQ